MTVAAGVETAIEVWELTLPEEEAGCEWPCGCSNEVRWRMVGPCGCGISACQPHFERQVERIKGLTKLRCNLCGMQGLPTTVRWFRV
jgi:hypothetical protein